MVITFIINKTNDRLSEVELLPLISIICSKPTIRAYVYMRLWYLIWQSASVVKVDLLCRQGVVHPNSKSIWPCICFGLFRTCDNNAIINTRAAPHMWNEMSNNNKKKANIRYHAETNNQRRCLMKVKSRKSFVRIYIEMRFSLYLSIYLFFSDWQFSEAYFLCGRCLYHFHKYDKCDSIQPKPINAWDFREFVGIKMKLIFTSRGCLHLHT